MKDYIFKNNFMFFLFKIFVRLVIIVYIIGGQVAVASCIIKSENCKTSTSKSPLEDIPYNENGESMPCDSEETQEEFKEVSLPSGLYLNFPLSCKISYSNYKELTLLTPHRNIFSPPPECFFIA